MDTNCSGIGTNIKTMPIDVAVQWLFYTNFYQIASFSFLVREIIRNNSTNNKSSHGILSVVHLIKE